MATDRSVVRRYYLFRATNAAGFYLPISVLYLLDQGFGLGFVALVQATFSLAMLAAEIPSGYLGDRIGRRASLAVGNLLRAAGMAGYAFVETPVGFVAMQVVWATGWAFRSGTGDAWLYELLARTCDDDGFARIKGRGSTVLLLTSAVTAIAGGLLYGVAHELPFLLSATLAVAGVPVLYTFPSVRVEDDDADVFTVREAVRMLRVQASRESVRWLVAYVGLFYGLFGLARMVEQPALDALGVPAAGLGVVFAAFKLVSAGAASTAGWFEERLGARGVFGLLVPVFAVAFVIGAFFPVFLVPTFFLYRSVRSVVQPVQNQYLNDRLADVGRATVLSGVSMVLSLSSGLMKLATGGIAEQLGPLAFLPRAGAVVVVVACLLWFLTRPVRSGAGTAAVPGGGAAASD
ncbi:MFS transporter [Haloarchaeobius litoreus]|uniref:MFS transporter n=1 Tax=Haloarchaeobius litoreus TaxID=755306 RepID=A0ABD6DJ82_9EURY|nr:MFS transporter [Haloarchaeobius litoreus]